jgi:ABC-type glycerol-3-phosphate transport system permease component
MKKQEKSIVNKIFVAFVFVVLALYTITIIYPLVWGLITSLKSHYDFTIDGNVIGFPNLDASVTTNSRKEFFQFENYQVVFKNFNFIRRVSFYIGDLRVQHQSENNVLTMIANTFLLAFLGSFLQSFVPCIVAYAVAKFDFKYSKLLFACALFAMIMPVVGAYPSEITMLRNLGLYDTLLGYFLQKCNFMGMYFFVYHGFYKAFPNSYTEAAEIDGASYFRCLISIILPLSVKMISSVFLIQFVHFWNDYQTTYLYMPTYPTLAYGVWFLTFGSNQSLTKITYRVAGAMTLALPILVVFIVLKDKLMGNITMGGIKQ